MSPSSSAHPAQDRTRSRNSSNATPVPGQEASKPSPNPTRPSSSRTQSPHLKSPASKPPNYTVFIRLPFARGNFEDPQPVEWNATKDRQLWKLISGGKGDVDWEGLSHDFGVDLGFLVMQGAWLSERHMERMRKQVGRIAVHGEVASASGSTVGGIKMERTGSRESKVQSPTIAAASAFKRDSPVLQGEVSPGTSTPQARIPISRTPSTVTVTQSKVTSSTTRQPPRRAFRGSSGEGGRRPQPLVTTGQDSYNEDAIEHEGPAEQSESEDELPASRSRALRRPKQALASDGDDEDDESASYLPFASRPADPAATLRNPAKPKPPVREDSTATTATTTTESSNSSMQPSDRPPGPLSPRHRAQLASMSPRSRKTGSDGSPSMGSSFSDLDDASVTQSALEDALNSHMRTNPSSIGSRMSSLRDAALGRRQ